MPENSVTAPFSPSREKKKVKDKKRRKQSAEIEDKDI